MMLTALSYAATLGVGCVVGVIVGPALPDKWRAKASDLLAKAKAWIDAHR